MIANCFNRLVFASERRLALPIATYPGLALTGATVRQAVSDSQVQFDAVAALHARYRTPVVLSAMDLSAEAEAFGCALHLSDNEIPSVTGRLVTTLEQARALPVPQPGDRRTAVYLDTVRRLKKLPSRPLVLGGCIGPFSLASRLVGVSEALEMTLAEPELMAVVLEKSTTFLAGYARAFQQAGADGVIMAEPAAGLLSPRGVAAHSSAYIKSIAAAVCDGEFALILHNCAARGLHLAAILETGLSTFHFGAPMDLPAALERVPSEVVLCGNLDPASVFCQAAPTEMRARASELLSRTAAHRNCVLSSGCDLPASAPLANLDALYAVVAGA
ncbi:MAG TPA: uroporphyrinogen decarboxylase family protein [Verrucomicrobiota bacterium]|jgi:uroporphyrinogen decarboxylase|nr:uroporphyrinogen decarboxylase family protein [Verrucomicrobiota bacterium]HQL77898.1 uroporphyrinogen decarboxylase family protein [Verrucomicrobiota bacterium]